MPKQTPAHTHLALQTSAATLIEDAPVEQTGCSEVADQPARPCYRKSIMTNRNRRNFRYLIEANGRDSEGTSFQFFDGAQGWGAACQAISAMFRRVPNPGSFKVFEGDPETGRFADVTTEILAGAENAVHQGVLHDDARQSKVRVRRQYSIVHASSVERGNVMAVPAGGG